MSTISQAITNGADLLRSAGVDQERRTAGLLLSHVTGINRTRLLTKSEERIVESDYRDYLALVARRAAGEPLQYLTGHQEFYGLDFVVNSDVLIPRPETEFLVERVIDVVRPSREDSQLIVDIGTGSGCIAVTLAKHLPRARLIATDAFPGALNVAQENARRHGVRDRIEFLEGDLLAPLAEHALQGAVDVLVSNPPYVDEESCEALQREVRDWEPREALFGGPDGLLFYRRLLADGLEYLKPRGNLIIEIGYGQFDSISNEIDRSQWELADVTPDLQGIPRTLTLRTPSENS
jgi:release factor glutamine methyltransferase